MRQLIALFFAIFSISYAHQLWIEKNNNQLIAYYGHLKEKEIIPLSVKDIKKIVCITDGKSQIIKPASYPVKIKKNCDFTYIEVSTGYWSKTIHGTVKGIKENKIMSWKSIETALRIDRWREKVNLNGFVIIPVKNPLNLKVGDKLRLKVILNGKPVPDIPVSYDGKVRGLTDKNGRINIRIKHSGLQIIQASLRKKSISEPVDYIIYSGNLNFEVK